MKPEGGEQAVKRIGDGSLFSFPNEGDELAADLVWPEGPFELRLIVAHEKKAIGRDPGDPVQNHDALIPTVENDVIPAKRGDGNLLNQGLVPAGDKKGIHTVPLGFDPDDISIPEKRFKICFVHRNSSLGYFGSIVPSR